MRIKNHLLTIFQIQPNLINTKKTYNNRPKQLLLKSSSYVRMGHDNFTSSQIVEIAKTKNSSS